MAGQELVVLRHGLRFDEVEATWAAQAERPWDPPLAPGGIAQVLCSIAATGGPVAHHSMRVHDAPSCFLVIYVNTHSFIRDLHTDESFPT